MGRNILTMFRGNYVNNNDLQKILLQDALLAEKDKECFTADYLRRLVDNLEKIKEN